MIQSFAVGEVSPELAHEIGQQFADEVLQGKYEYVLATHIDKGHVHNHIIFNAVNFVDYHAYKSYKKIYYETQEISDRLCKENGLSVIPPSQSKGKSYKEYTEAKNGTSWKQKLKMTIDRSVITASGYEDFLKLMEESGFYNAASEHGYTKQQTFYARGYDALPGPLVRFAAIIINDIDDMVHGQMQGRQGMFNDVTLLAKTGKLQSLICSLLESGFSVYLTADHGNTHCVGGGSIKRTGVETETKSKRMIVLKDFAEVSDDLRDRTIVYPGYYMDKSYQYMICKGDTSFDNKGEDVMTHGGISIEEVIVPFIKIRSKHNG